MGWLWRDLFSNWVYEFLRSLGFALIVGIFWAACGWIYGLPGPILATCVFVAVTCTVAVNRRKSIDVLPFYGAWKRRSDRQIIEEIRILFRLSYDGEGAYKLACDLLESGITISLPCEEQLAGDEGNCTGNYQKVILFESLILLLQRAVLDPSMAALSALSNALDRSDTIDCMDLECIQTLFANYFREYESMVEWVKKLRPPFVSRDFQPSEEQFNRWQSLDGEFQRKVREARARKILE